jgi:hypothetical protein
MHGNIHVQDNEITMIAKLELWGKHLIRGVCDLFPFLYDFIVKSDEDLNADVL